VTALDDLVADLAAEQRALDVVVAPLDAGGLRIATPAEGWDIVDELSHLAGFDEAATTALVDPDGFTADLERRLAEGDDPVAAYTAQGRALEPVAVRDWWRTSRAGLLAAIVGVDPKARIPWYGPPMSAMSFVTARLMETWAHGQDIRDALGAAPEVSERLRHVAHIGVGARPFSYVIRDLETPAEPVDVLLVAPDGSTWSWGPGDAADSISGSALDFCLVVTQRRHRDDVDLAVRGPRAEEWIGIAQAFAGGIGPGRAAGQFTAD
jgi:uncharacterized protein (TIGR03084 family)